MLESFLYSLNVILPIFILVILGFILGRYKFLTPEFLSVSEKFVFKIALPCMLFLEVAHSNISETLDVPLIIFCCTGIIISFIVLCLTVPVFIKSNDKRGAFIQGVYRSNFAILGVPLAENMFGESGVKIIAIVMPFAIVIFNVLAVVVLSMFAPADKKKSTGVLIKEIAKNIITNPLIIAIVLAVPFMLTSFKLPVFLDKSITYLSNTTFSLALMSLGANFTSKSIKGRISLSIAASVLKTAVIPFAAVFIAVILGFTGEPLGIIFILFGAPTAVSSYIMAKNMGSDYELAGQILLLTTMMCLFTLFLGIFIMKSLSLI